MKNSIINKILALLICFVSATTFAQYGSGIGADALNNIQIGGTWNSQMSYVFIADVTGQLAAVKPYIIWTVPGGTGYNNGTGGKMLFSLQSDDGTSNHFPSGTTLASYLLTNPTGGSNFPVITFTSPASVVKGTMYHLVVSNPDTSPTTNYASIDCLWLENATSPLQPIHADSVWKTLIKYDTDPWQILAPTEHYTPIIEMQYSGGHRQGLGYMEVWIESPHVISGNSSVRQNFTVTGNSKVVSSVAVRAKRISGSDPLTLRLETSSGTLIESGTVSVGTSYEWATVTFSSKHTLISGSSYNLVLQSPSNSTFETYPIRKGSSVNVGYNSATYFNDGYAQFTTGGGWVGWDIWGTYNRTDSDLQFMFICAPPVVNTKIFLQGPYSGSSMSTSLSSQNYIPLAQPYGGAPWSYAGTEAVAGIPAGVVDWVLVELRTGTAAATKVVTRAAFIKSDGTVVDIDGSSTVSFSGVEDGAYYVVIRHRNHLAVMSSSLVTLNATSTLYDFTSGLDKYYGGDAKEVATGVFGMWAGDVTANGIVKYMGSGNDRAPILTRIGGTDLTATVSGYYTEDVNMNGIVKYTGSGNDCAIILQVIGGSDMTATRSSNVPN